MSERPLETSGDAEDEAALRAEVDAEIAAERAARPRASDRVAGLVLLLGILRCTVQTWLSAVLQHRPQHGDHFTDLTCKRTT